MNIKQKIIGFLLALVALLGGGYSVSQLGGSLEQGSMATTTGSTATITTLKTGAGQLDTVAVTKSDVGTLSFYNATTSDITKRTGNVATSTLLIAVFPASATAGAYPLNAAFTNGLLMVTTASVSSSTVLWK